jgi:hypothetical protein
MSANPFQNNDVARVFGSYPLAIRNRPLALRSLIFDVAKKTPGVERVEETLKWGETAYLAYAARETEAAKLRHANR